jgi:uncharacterized membrane protein
MSRWINTYSFTIKKTASYYVTHIMVAAMVAYTVTSDLVTAVTLSSLVPSVQAVVYFFHERLWQSIAFTQNRAAIQA